MGTEKTSAKKPFYKKWWVWLIAIIVIGVIGSPSNEEKDAAKKEEETKIEASAPGEKEFGKKSVEGGDGKAQAIINEIEVEKEKEQPKPDTSEKDYYEKVLLPEINGVIGVYDRIWDEYWAPTFAGIADGSMDVYTAYGKMKELEQRYGALMKQIANIKGDELSKENKKVLAEFTSEFKDSSMMRQAAGKDAMKMFDKGTFSPSELDKVTESVEIADRLILKAIANKLTLEASLGVVAK